MNHNISKAIIVWRFSEAPEEYRKLSDNGGDEDWLAFLPEDMKSDYIPWLDGETFGCCDTSTYPVVGGVVRIGSHA